MRQLTVILLILCCTSVQAGGGIQLSLYGHRSTGMANTGTGLALGGHAIFFNPGAVAFVFRNHLAFGASIIFSNTQFLAETPSVYRSNADPSQFYTPIYLYSSWRPRGGRLAIGLGFNNPFGHRIAWPEDWKGRFIVQEYAISAYYVQPTLSFQLTDRLGLGFGLIYGFGNLLLRKGLPVSGVNLPEGSAEFSGSGTGWGFAAGLYFRASPRFSLGISYRSALNLKVSNGKALFTVPGSLESSYPNTSFQSTIPLPATLSVGMAYYPSSNFTLAIDLVFTNWSPADTITLDFADNTPALPDDRVARNLSNAFSLRIGAEYGLNEIVNLRTGAFYEGSPVEDGFLSPELPDADQVGVTAGAGIRITRDLHLDLSYVYSYAGERTGILQEAGFGGKYISWSSTFGLGINYAF